MLVNKKLDRFKQWAGERMGGEVKTNTTDQFKALEQEMELRQNGMEKMQESMSAYMKAVSKRTEIERKEKNLPIAYLGSTMIAHGEDFEHDSEFGQCLSAFGRTQERLARSQETFIIESTNSWLESLDRSLVQMKEYQASRKKLESRRLAYDTSLAKMQKAKREDFRVEEELRSQQAKYEEAEADVERRMFDIKDAEGGSVVDLTAFLEAQLSYHDRCREALLQLQNEWPAQSAVGRTQSTRPTPRSRSNTTRSFFTVPTREEEEPIPETRPSIRSIRSASSRYAEPSTSEYEGVRARPGIARSTTYQSTPQPRRDISPVASNRLSRVPSDSLMIQSTRMNLRRVDTASTEQDVFADDARSPSGNSYESPWTRGPVSPSTPQSSNGSITPATGARKAPPPPPPSRSSKPGLAKAAPPPPPVKRTLIT